MSSFWAFRSSSNLEQLSPFWAIFCERNIIAFQIKSLNFKLQNYPSGWFCESTLEFLSFFVMRWFTWRPTELSCRLGKWLISGNFAIWTVYEWEKVLIWRLWFPREVNSRICSKTRWQMFLVGFRLPCWCLNGWAPGQHSFSIQISTNLG